MIDRPVNYVGVSGFGWSGSGAVVDLICEVRGCGAPGFEFSLVKEPHGIIDLECFLVEHWDIIRHDHAIREFSHYCKVLNRPNRRFGHWGLNMGEALGVDFMRICHEYIDALADFEYFGASRIHHYEQDHFGSLVEKIARRLGLEFARGRKMHLARPSEETFLAATHTFINSLLEPYAQKNNLHTLVLDQAIPTSNIDKALRYFEGMKLIVVDRDPRDIYVDQVNHSALLGANHKDEERVSKYILWHKKIRQNLDSVEQLAMADSVLKVRFEDLISNYELASSEIIAFLNLKKVPREKRSVFNPEKSAKNIGLWKDFPMQDDIRNIESAFF